MTAGKYEGTSTASVVNDGLDASGGPDELAVRVAELLGLDSLMVAEAMAQAHEELYAVEGGIGDNGSGWDMEGGEDLGKRSAGPDTGG